MPSPRFGQLSDQLAALRRHLLPETFDPTGSYEGQDRVSTQAIAFRVLAHAEIEAYFEDQAVEVARRARDAWDGGRPSRVALCLLAFSGKEMTFPPDTLEPPTENKRKSWPSLVNVSEKLVPTVSAFYHLARNENHGIKEKNLLSLLLPIGVDPTRIDPAFLADMDSFGTLRGLAAHSSGRGAVTKAVNPEEEFKRVEALVPGIEALDTEFELLLATLAA